MLMLGKLTVQCSVSPLAVTTRIEPGTKMGMKIIDIIMSAENASPHERHHVGNAEIVKGFPLAAANGASSLRQLS